MNLFLITCCAVFFCISYTNANYVRGGSPDTVGNAAGRDLAVTSSAVQGDFQPLSCNAGLASSTCTKFTSQFGQQAIYNTRIKIDCGACYYMDVTLPEVTFAQGLEINGKLVFADGYKITVKATAIVVQGELEVTSTKEVDGTPDVQFVIIGNADNQSFIPLNENQNICNGTACNVGARPFAVAGGKVNFNGLPPNTPTWVRLYDVVSGPGPEQTLPSTMYDSYVSPPAISGCASNGVYIDEDFSNPTLANATFGDTGYAQHSFTGDAIKIYSRKYYYKGLQVDLSKVRPCLLADQPYIVTVTVRLLKNNNAGNLTTCAQSKGFCMRFFQGAVSTSGTLSSSNVWVESPKNQVKYNVPFSFTMQVKFSSDDISLSKNKQQLLWLDGPAIDVDMSVEHFRLERPPSSAYPNPNAVCANLVPGNEGAEDVGLSPFPFKSASPYVMLNVVDDPVKSGNHAFSATDGCCGLAWNFPVACLKERMQLRFHADFLVQKDTDVTVRLVIQRAGGTALEVLADCALTASLGWQSCDTSYTVPDAVVQGTEQNFMVRFDATGGYLADNISLSVESGPPVALVVDKSVMNKWGPGSEIVITSHTTTWSDYQVRRVTDVSASSETGYAVVTLDSAIHAPITMQDSPDFAVEVALLSRNIVFDAETYSPDPLIGGHFWILFTPNVVQSVVGVEVKNFGQAGTLGRYPIHFHFLNDGSGSVIAKNTIRQSNQRCVIVHGTNNLLIQENIAFDTPGHCFMLEDGIEVGNKFIRNLGIATTMPKRMIPNHGETDNLPSTFWITNPQNTFIDNVAAGSENSGFWFQLLKRGDRAALFPDLNPKIEMLDLFQGNIAHSNARRGITTYPHGFLPTQKATFSGLKVYRNQVDGIFLHQTLNVAITDSLFADNQVNIDLGVTDDIVVNNITIIGESGSYRNVMDTQGAETVCLFWPELVGIMLHTFTIFPSDDGASIQNIRFKNFTSSSCTPQALAFGGNVTGDSRLFRWPVSVQNINVGDASETIDFCQSLSDGVTTSFLVDIDGSLKPPSISLPSSPSSVITDHPDMTAFVDSTQCTKVTQNCNQYCPNTCFRSARFYVSPTGTSGFSLRVCQTGTGRCRNYPGYLSSRTMMNMTDSRNRRMFPAYLPKGAYTVQFVGSSGQPGWPTFVETSFDSALCANSIVESDLTLLKPSVNDSTCSQLIRNGNAEASSTDYPFWLHNGEEIQLAVGKGRSGSNAISDVKIVSTFDQISQFVDTRCMGLMKGRVYEIMAWVRLIKKDGSQLVCDPSAGPCPTVALMTSDGRMGTFARVQSEGSPGAYQFIHGLVTISDDLVATSSVSFAVVRNRVDVRFMVDDISMTLMPDVTSSSAVCTSNIVMNGNFNSGDSRYWDNAGSGQRIVNGGSGNWALELTDSRPMMYSKCFVQGKSYSVSIKFKLVNSMGQQVLCDSSLPCPSVYLLTEKAGVRTATDCVGKVSGSTTASGWNQISGNFTASSTVAGGDKHSLWFFFKKGYKLQIDDVIVRAA